MASAYDDYNARQVTRWLERKVKVLMRHSIESMTQDIRRKMAESQAERTEPEQPQR